MKTIAFDFDGVIHKYRKGWLDGSIYDDLDYELLNFIGELLANYNVVIFTARDTKQVLKHLKKCTIFRYEICNTKFWNKKGTIGITNIKPAAVLYVDDRAYEYLPQASTTTNIKLIKERLDYENRT